MKKAIITFIFLIATVALQAHERKKDQSPSLSNDLIGFALQIDNEQLTSEHFKIEKSDLTLKSDGNFAVSIVWTDWIAPGMSNNAENPVTLTKEDFTIVNYKQNDLQLDLFLSGKSTSLQVKIQYELQQGKSYIRRKIAIRDSLFEKHFLHKISAYDAHWKSSSFTRPLKEGGFGQPVAVTFGDNGFYAGLEYPASTNFVKQESDSIFNLTCSRLIGQKITNEWIESEWVVIGLTPGRGVKKAFMSYLDDIKIEPNRPFTLYNSWYDLRGEKYPVGSYVKALQDEDYMTEANVLRLYELFQRDFAEKHDVELDAFVLDDGWDVYESDWVLNKNEFPNGLKPLKEEFERNNTSLGLWFGPSGGYSARMKRIDWYRNNGYEVVGQEKQWGGAQLCLGGKKYSQLFKKRTTEFVNQGVSYYKWDGFQFSCSEPDHGHPIGLYSQVAILDTLLSSIEAVHQINSEVYHSVTSGTWLSPWWLKHAHQIWMQGEDYGLAEVPSYDSKDAAITYRDIVLYDDLQNKKFWFPVSNMMTHGIIKGKLEELYLDTSLNKFADNVVLYFARGVSMYELYTSPDMMKEEEWKVVADALKWAKDHFSTLMNTEMVGGDPGKKEAYGYVHLKGNEGIVAARNPFIGQQDLKVVLNPDFGLEPNASNLVLEKVYPYRWIAPELYAAGDSINLPLSGYETAIYEIYPLVEATEPLIAGVPFQTEYAEMDGYKVQCFGEEVPIILNKKSITSIKYENEVISFDQLPRQEKVKRAWVSDFKGEWDKDTINIWCEINENIKEASLAFLFSSADDAPGWLPEVKFELENKQVPSKFNGKSLEATTEPLQISSGWYSIPIEAGKHALKLIQDIDSWKGKVEVWAIGTVYKPGVQLEIKMRGKTQSRTMVPVVMENGIMLEKVKLGEILIR
ncbi:MAG: alpha-galactosidase [Reichenbachiella sp.]|uniref:alpha-galactosidase n=1 Tax=Reichenbachiella sp. TaxID=2184521 RepID=UPI0029673C59|nr:alpha-galactosidase [Reichenbachiella sp.]MDW3211466.1 alpha-galactosidase [Reichenbachiella sp.]